MGEKSELMAQKMTAAASLDCEKPKSTFEKRKKCMWMVSPIKEL